MKKHANIRSVLIALSILLAMGLGSTVFAEPEAEAVLTPEQPEAENVIVNNIPDSDVLFEEFMMKTAQEELGEGQEVKKSHRKDKLDGNCVIAYEYLLKEIKKLANGEISNSVIEIPITEFLGDDAYREYTAEDLNVESIIRDGEITKDAVDAMYAKLGFGGNDAIKTLKALIFDVPYELYWYDKTEGIACDSYPGLEANDEAIWFTDDSAIIVSFTVSRDYRDAEYDLNEEWVAEAVASAQNAAGIVEDCKQLKSDYERLDAYKDIICEGVSYNYQAIDEGWYGDPYQLVWVFDNDPNTNVVCEGYSKAFKFLCDLTEFNSEDLDCNTVTGEMGQWTEEGGKEVYKAESHMWNIVRMGNKENYHVDITNCDRREGWTSDYFLKGSDEVYSDEDKYTVNDLDYYYDNITREMFDDDELAISTTDYRTEDDPEEAHVHAYGEWTIVEQPTCIRYGKVIRECTGCDKTEVANTAKGDHDFGNWEVIVEPTYDREGEQKRECDVCKLIQKEKLSKLPKTSLAKATVTGLANKTYSGKAFTPVPTVKLNNKTLKKGTDYKLTYKNNKNVGKATVTITGINAYKGTINKTFKINPKGTSLKTVTALDNGFIARWAKQATQTSGYQVQYCLKSNFSSGAKIVTVSGAKTITKKVVKLKNKKAYYVRMRTFKTVSGVKYCSGWSANKKVTTK